MSKRKRKMQSTVIITSNDCDWLLRVLDVLEWCIKQIRAKLR